MAPHQIGFEASTPVPNPRNEVAFTLQPTPVDSGASRALMRKLEEKHVAILVAREGPILLVFSFYSCVLWPLPMNALEMAWGFLSDSATVSFGRSYNSSGGCREESVTSIFYRFVEPRRCAHPDQRVAARDAGRAADA